MNKKSKSQNQNLKTSFFYLHYHSTTTDLSFPKYDTLYTFLNVLYTRDHTNLAQVPTEKNPNFDSHFFPRSTHYESFSFSSQKKQCQT